MYDTSYNSLLQGLKGTYSFIPSIVFVKLRKYDAKHSKYIDFEYLENILDGTPSEYRNDWLLISSTKILVFYKYSTNDEKITK